MPAILLVEQLMLIEAYRVEIGVSTHSAEEIEYEAIAHLDVDLSPVQVICSTY